jgi:hypothetical protein
MTKVTVKIGHKVEYLRPSSLIQRLVCPQTYYMGEDNNPYPPGIYFFSGITGEDPRNSVVFFSEDYFGNELMRRTIHRESTILVDDSIPLEAIQLAKQLGLKVCKIQSLVVEYI